MPGGLITSDTETNFGHGTRARILIIDEDLSDLVCYFDVLHQAGYEVHCISAIADALAHVGDESLDLIIASPSMWDSAEGSILARVVEKHYTTPVLVLGRYADSMRYLEAMQLGARDYLEKPLHPSEMVALVAGFLPVSTRVLTPKSVY